MPMELRRDESTIMGRRRSHRRRLTPPWTWMPQLLVLMLCVMPLKTCGIEFDMVFQTKCVFEEVAFEESVAGEFDVFQSSKPDEKVPVTVRITNQDGEEVYQKIGGDSDKFMLQNLKEGTYKICFTAKSRC